jgi:hypothetical protein
MQVNELKRWVLVTNSIYRNKSTNLNIDGNSDIKYPSCKAVTSYVNSTIIYEKNEQYTISTVPTTSFTLTWTPSDNTSLRMFINGVMITKTSFSVTGKIVTYDPILNGGYVLNINDRVNILYLTKEVLT